MIRGRRRQQLASQPTTSTSSSSYNIRDQKMMNQRFQKRNNGMKKKISELSTLCDIDSCMISYGPDGELYTWPENLMEVLAVINRYKQVSNKEEKEEEDRHSDFLIQNEKRNTSATVITIDDDDDDLVDQKKRKFESETSEDGGGDQKRMKLGSERRETERDENWDDLLENLSMESLKDLKSILDSKLLKNETEFCEDGFYDASISQFSDQPELIQNGVSLLLPYTEENGFNDSGISQFSDQPEMIQNRVPLLLPYTEENGFYDLGISQFSDQPEMIQNSVPLLLTYTEENGFSDLCNPPSTTDSGIPNFNQFSDQPENGFPLAIEENGFSDFCNPPPSTATDSTIQNLNQFSDEPENGFPSAIEENEYALSLEEIVSIFGREEIGSIFNGEDFSYSSEMAGEEENQRFDHPFVPQQTTDDVFESISQSTTITTTHESSEEEGVGLLIANSFAHHNSLDDQFIWV